MSEHPAADAGGAAANAAWAAGVAIEALKRRLAGMEQLRSDLAETLALLPQLADAIDKLLNGDSCYHYPEEQLMQQARKLAAKHAAAAEDAIDEARIGG